MHCLRMRRPKAPTPDNAALTGSWLSIQSNVCGHAGLTNTTPGVEYLRVGPLPRIVEASSTIWPENMGPETEAIPGRLIPALSKARDRILVWARVWLPPDPGNHGGELENTGVAG